MPFERGKPGASSGKTGAPIQVPSTPRPIAKPIPIPEGPIHENLSRTHLSLRAIRDELQMFEQEIKWRDERIGEIEKELQDSKTQLDKERAKGPQTDGGALAERLREARQQIDQHAQSLRERDSRIRTLAQNERGLLDRIQTLTNERAKGTQALAEMVKQIQDQQRRTQSLEKKLLAVQREKDLAALGNDNSAIGPQSGLIGRWITMRWPARVGVVAAVLLIAMGSLAAGGMTLLRAEPVYHVAGHLVVASADAERLQQELKADPAHRNVGFGQKPLGPQVASVQLWLDTKTLDEDKLALDTLGQSLVEKLTPAPATQPATAAKREELERRLATLDQQLAALTTQPALAGAPEKGWLDAWQKQLTERQEVEAQLKLLRPRLAAVAPDAAHFVVDPAKVAAAQTADARLQADQQALTAKQQQLRGLLRKRVESNDVLFKHLPEQIEAATKDVKGASPDNSDSDVTQTTESISKALTEWSRHVSDLKDAWQTAQSGLGDDQSDVGGLHAKLEPAVRSFIDRMKAGRDRMQKAIETLGEGGEEPTKRIVLRNALSRHLKPVFEAQDNAVQLVQPLLAANDAELTGLLQSVGGLRTQVDEQKNRLAAAVRAESLERAQKAYNQDVSQARIQQEKWLKRAAELDDGLLVQNREVLKLLPQLDGQRSSAQRRAELYQDRSQVLGQLADLLHREAEALAHRGERLTPWYIPAEATQLPVSPKQRLGQAMVLGAMPVTAGFFLLAAIWAGQLWVRSRQLARDYERLLRDAGRVG